MSRTKNKKTKTFLRKSFIVESESVNQFMQDDMRATQIINSLLKKYIPDDSTFETWFTAPYDSSERRDVYIEYGFDDENTRFWKKDVQEEDESTAYEGTIYLKINRFLVGNEDEDWWESAQYDDVPDWVWSEDFNDSVYKKIKPILNSFNVDVDFDYTFIKED